VTAEPLEGDTLPESQAGPEGGPHASLAAARPSAVPLLAGSTVRTLNAKLQTKNAMLSDDRGVVSSSGSATNLQSAKAAKMRSDQQ